MKTKRISQAEFKRRLKALGYLTPGDAARALGLARSSVHRMWHNGRPIHPRTVRLLELLEQAQPAPMTKLQRRMLLTAEQALPGAVIHEPEARSNFDARIDWAAVFEQMVAEKLVTTWGGRMVLTQLGARCVEFLQQRKAAA